MNVSKIGCQFIEEVNVIHGLLFPAVMVDVPLFVNNAWNGNHVIVVRLSKDTVGWVKRALHIAILIFGNQLLRSQLGLPKQQVELRLHCLQLTPIPSKYLRILQVLLEPVVGIPHAAILHSKSDGERDFQIWRRFPPFV